MEATEKKIAIDMFYVQMQWSLWTIPFILLGYLIILPFIGNFADIPDLNLNFMSFIFQPAKIYMLIIGIISSLTFIPFFVKNGVTRKQYFMGSAIGAVGVALGINIITAIITGILRILSRFIPLIPSQGQMAFPELSPNWVVAIIIYSLIILTFYLAGWLIGAGFYQSGFHGAKAIVLSVVLLALLSLIWEGQISFPFSINVTFPSLVFPLPFLANLFIIGLGLWLIRTATKDIPITVK